MIILSKRPRKKRRKKTAAMKVGTKRWASYKPGKIRLYQLQQVISSTGAIKQLSYWMPKSQAAAWALGYNKRAGRRGRVPMP